MADQYDRIEKFIRDYISEYNQCERIGAGLAEGDRYSAMNNFWAEDITFARYAPTRQAMSGRDTLKGLMTKSTSREEIEIVDLIVDDRKNKADAIYFTTFYDKDSGAKLQDFHIHAMYSLSENGEKFSIQQIDLFRPAP